MIDLKQVPPWLLAVGVFAIGIAALWTFVLPGRGIEWAGAYYGPYRLSSDIENLKLLSARLEDVTQSAQSGTCVKFKDESPFCFGVVDATVKDNSRSILSLTSSMGRQQQATRYVFSAESIGCPSGWKNKGKIGFIMENSNYDKDLGRGVGYDDGKYWTWAHPFLCEQS